MYGQYQEFFEDVVEWNYFSRNGKHDFSAEAIRLQQRLVNEEYNETDSAIYIEDAVEILDGICDVFVVASYLHYLTIRQANAFANTNAHEIFFFQESVDKLSLCDLIDQIVDTMSGTEFVPANLLVGVMERARRQYGFDVDGAMREVLASNWSKFPLIKDVEDVESECRRIEQETVYTNVVALTVNDRYVFRCNHGEGKIVKPFTFKAPNLSQFVPNM